MTTDGKSRDDRIDVVKGIAIILVVLGHSGFPATHWVYLFHMAVFFICAGYFITEKNYNTVANLKKTIWKRFYSLYFPYVVSNLGFLWLNNYFYRIHVYSFNIIGGGTQGILSFTGLLLNSLKILVFWSSTTLGGATWFFRVLFIAIFVYLCGCFLIFRMIPWRFDLLVIAFCTFCGIMGFTLKLAEFNIGGCGTALSVVPFLEIGRRMNSEPLKSHMANCSSLAIRVFGCIIIVLLGILGIYENVLLNKNEYKCLLTMLLCGYLGWLLLYSTACLFCRRLSHMRTILSYVGKNTIPILCLHFLAFKVVSAMQVMAYHSEIYNIASFPIYLKTGFWWIAYTLVGVILPLFVNQVYKNLKKRIMMQCLK